MIAKLSDELAGELERNGDGPLAVENPRTNKLYVLVPMDRYALTAQQQLQRRDDTPNTWNAERNARRFTLIEREISGEITSDEAVELAELQCAADAYLRSVAPLPWSGLESLHDELMKKAVANTSTT